MLLKRTLYRWTLAVLMACFAMHAMAEGREFPVNAKRGKLSVTAMADLVIDGKLKLSTSATKIYSEEGLMITSSALQAFNSPVNYTINEFGEIEKLWLLTAEEARQAPPKK